MSSEKKTILIVDDEADARAFVETVARGQLNDHAEAPYTYADMGKRVWSVEYRRDGQTLGIEVDLMEWELDRRWTHHGELGWPMLEAPVARQNADGHVAVGGAELTCGPYPAWLFADPPTNTWVAGYHGPPGPLTLTVPHGAVHLDAMGTGTVTWQDGAVTIDAIDLEGVPQITGGERAD